MTLAQLQDYTFNTKYARYNPAIGRRETFAEAADRVFAMHEGKYAHFGIQDEIEYAKAAVKDVGSSRVDLQACKLEYSIVSPK